MSKKIMSIMLAIFMLASLCVVGITSASAVYNSDAKYGVEATGGENMSLKAGESVTVTLAVDTGLHAWQNGQFTIYFDSSKFSTVNPYELLGQEAIEYKKATYPGIAVFGNEQVIANVIEAGEGEKYSRYNFNFTFLEGANISINDDQCRIAVLTFTAKEDIADLSEVVFAVDAFEVTVYTDEKDYHNGGEEIVPAFVSGALNDTYVNSFSFTVTGGTPIETETTENTDNTGDTGDTGDTGNTDNTDNTGNTDNTEDTANTDNTEDTANTDDTSATTTAATTEAPAGGSQQTGEASTAVALMVVALMAAGVVIFARKKAAK